MTYKQVFRWTPTQEQYVRDNYKTMKDEQIAVVLGRTKKSVTLKRQRIECEKTSGGRGKFGIKDSDVAEK